MSLESLEGKYENDRIFLIGNGPSLAETPLSLLNDEYSLAMNKINHIYAETEWRPSFYYNTKKDPNAKEQRFIQDHIDSGRPCFLESVHEAQFGQAENVYYIDRQELKHDHPDATLNFHALNLEDIKEVPVEHLEQFWSEDIPDVVYTYHSMYGVMQLVTYLGFDELYLVGCDLGFDVHDPHMVFGDGLDPLEYTNDEKRAFLRESYAEGALLKSLVNGLVYKLYHSPLIDVYSRLTGSVPSDEDPNHFADNYRERPKDNTYANLEILKSHMAAKRILAERGVDVYNATVGGELEEYTRVDIKDVV